MKLKGTRTLFEVRSGNGFGTFYRRENGTLAPQASASTIPPPAQFSSVVDGESHIIGAKSSGIAANVLGPEYRSTKRND